MEGLPRARGRTRAGVLLTFGLLLFSGQAGAIPLDAQIPVGTPGGGCPSCLTATNGTVSITYTWSNTGGDTPKVTGTVPKGAKVLYVYLEGAPSGYGYVLSYINLSHGTASAHIFDAYADGRVVYPYKGWAMAYPFAGQPLDDGKPWRADAYFTQQASSWRMTVTLVIAYEVPPPPPPAPPPPPPPMDYTISVSPGSGVTAVGGVPLTFTVGSKFISGQNATCDLSVVNAPGGFSTSLSKSVLRPAWSETASLTVTARWDSQPGTYWFQVLCRSIEQSGNTDRFATFSVVVMPLPQGNFESLSSSGVASGWVFDPNVSSVSTDAIVYVSQPSGPPLSFSAPTNLYRSDVNAAYGITGNHGFSFAIPSNLLNTSRQVWIWGHGATPAGGGQVELAGSGKWYCAASAGDLYGTGSCSGRCVKSVPPSGNGVCTTDCDCGNASTGKYCYIGPNRCDSVTLLSKTLSGSQSIPFQGGTSWTQIANSGSGFVFSSISSRNVTVSFNYQFDFPTGYSWMTLNIRLLVDGVEVARDSGVTRGTRTFSKTVGPFATGSHYLSFEVQTILSSGPPITTTFYPGTITTTLVRN